MNLPAACDARGARTAPRWRPSLRVLAWAFTAAVAIGIAWALLFVVWPLPPTLLERRPVSSVLILDRTGAPLREVRSSTGERSVPLEGDQVPPWVRAAFVAVEDRRFDAHPGVDVSAVARAVMGSLRAGRVVSGASTIPQQLARRLVPRERTFAGKLQEMLWALRLSAHLDRERILVEYLNRVPLGHGTVGVEAASQLYFGRPARLLSVAQAALLAGIAHAPSREDPLRHPEAARARRDVALDRMVAAGLLSEDVATRARLEPLELVGDRALGRAPQFTLALTRALERRGLERAVTLRTTIEPFLQDHAERIVSEELAGPLADARVGQAAVVVLDNTNGEVLAWVGSRDYFDVARQGMNDGVTALRQPGSALKPLVYGLALASGMTPATVLPDVELTFGTETGTYAPRNYDKRVHGPVRLRTALQNSYNIPAVHLVELLSPERVLATLRSAGLLSLTEPPEHYGVGIVLGNGEVSLLELATAYRGLARGGVAAPPVDIVEAHDAHGALLSVPAPRGATRFLPRDVVALLTDILADEESRALAFGLDSPLTLPFPVAAKTGTSRAYVDNWTAGYTRERTVAVWAGNFDGTPMKNVSGITGAGVIFRRVMLTAMEGIDPAPLIDPRRFDRETVCPLSGLRAGPACDGAFEERFLPGTAPRSSCDAHRHVAARDGTCGRGRALALQPRYRAWARAEGFADTSDHAPCAAPAAAETIAAARTDVVTPPRLVSPATGDEYMLEPGIPSGQGVPLQVVAPGADRIEVRVDERRAMTLRPPFRTWLSMDPGRHRVAVFTPGHREPHDVAEFLVR